MLGMSSLKHMPEDRARPSLGIYVFSYGFDPLSSALFRLAIALCFPFIEALCTPAYRAGGRRTAGGLTAARQGPSGWVGGGTWGCGRSAGGPAAAGKRQVGGASGGV